MLLKQGRPAWRSRQQQGWHAGAAQRQQQALRAAGKQQRHPALPVAAAQAQQQQQQQQQELQPAAMISGTLPGGSVHQCGGSAGAQHARSDRLRVSQPLPQPPSSEEQQQHAADASASGCPFLSALAGPPPPASPLPWYRRLQQLTAPAAFQAAALGPHALVSVPGLLGLPGMVVVGDERLAKAVLAGEADGSITVAQADVLAARRLLGPLNMLMQPEPRHKYLRNLVAPAFSADAIARLLPRMEAVLARHLATWADAGSVKAHDALRRMTFEFIIAVVMGRDLEQADLDRLSGLYQDWTKGLVAWPFLDLPFTRFGTAMAARRALLAWFGGAAADARAALDAGRAVPGILGSLVAARDEGGNRLTDAELGDNLLLVLLAGFDTSSTTLTHVLAELARNPAVMGALRQEQEAVVARHGPSLTPAALRDMVYADAVVRETLRLHNIVSSVLRCAGRDISLGGAAIPAGSLLYLPLTHLALTDACFAADEPSAFRPERMLTHEGRQPGSQLPFGHGSRFCAGAGVALAEMRVFLALLARGYEFAADTDTKWVQALGQVPVNGLPATFSRRASAV